MGLKYTKRAMTSYEVHRFFHGLEVSFFPETFLCNSTQELLWSETKILFFTSNL